MYIIQKQARSASMYYPNPLLLPPALVVQLSSLARTSGDQSRGGAWDNRLIYFFLAFD